MGPEGVPVIQGVIFIQYIVWQFCYRATRSPRHFHWMEFCGKAMMSPLTVPIYLYFTSSYIHARVWHAHIFRHEPKRINQWVLYLSFAFPSIPGIELKHDSIHIKDSDLSWQAMPVLVHKIPFPTYHALLNMPLFQADAFDNKCDFIDSESSTFHTSVQNQTL